MSMYIYNARILPMDGDEIGCGYVLVENGKIAEVGEGMPQHVRKSDIDAEGKLLMPGFIDIHTHMGFIGDGAGEAL